MSQPFYSGNYSQQYCPPNSYDTTQPPSHTPAYNDYYNSGVTPSAHTVDDSSVLAQSYTYPDVDYIPDTAINNLPSYVSTHDQTPMVSHYPDSANQIPHQDVSQIVPGHCWTGPVQYTEVTTAQPNDLYDQRRGSCASSTSGNWYSQDEVNAGHYNHQQQNYHANHHGHALQHQQQSEPMNFGMYSPAQYLRTQQLAHSAPAVHHHLEVVVPYGTLPVHEPKLERRHSDAYQTLSDDSICHPTQFSPFIQSHPPSADSPAPSSVPDGDSNPNVREDLYAQQRRAAEYQYGLQVQQERKYQLSGQFEQFEANLVNDQEHTHHHQTHHHQASSSNHTHHLPTPVVPSQAHQRIPSHTHASPEAEEKKLSPSKKPALACMFCRKRKIACGPPSPDNPDRTCNQCARRKQVCEYPTESRRGIRKAQKEPAPEEPTVHTFVHGDAPQREGAIGPIRRPRRKRAN